MVLQETYELLDTAFYDKATTGKSNSNWSNYNNNLQVTVGDEYTTLTGTVSNTNNRYNVPQESIPTPPFIVEFTNHGEFTEYNRFYIGDRNIILGTAWSGNLATANKIKFTVKNGLIYCEHDGITETTTQSYTNTDYLQFRITTTGNPIKYSDFKVYPI